MKRKKQKPRHFVRNLLLVITLIVVGGLGWKISGVFVKSIWNGRNQINLVFQSQVVSFNPSAKSINVLMIPNNAFIEVTHGYGPYRADKIYQLGELEKRGGGKLLAESIQEYLGIPVDGYIVNLKFKIKNLKLRDYLGNETNLTKWDLVRLWWKIRGVREDKIKMIDLKEVSASEEIILPDGSKAIKIDPERLERILNQFFTDEGFKQDDLAIVVLNGTNHIGLANKGAKLIDNIGGRVVGVGDVGDINDVGSKCQVRSQKKNKNIYTVQKLMKIFGCEWDGENLEGQRSDVVLILGEQYWQKLNQP